MDFDYAPGRAGLRRLVCLFALALGLLAIAPASGLANPITTENALTGTSGWERSQADTPNVDGYTSKTSVAPGETMTSTSAQADDQLRIVLYRLGWYNGAGARQMACLPSCTYRVSRASHRPPRSESRHRQGRRRLDADPPR